MEWQERKLFTFLIRESYKDCICWSKEGFGIDFVRLSALKGRCVAVEIGGMDL